MKKIDFKQELKRLYRPSARAVEQVDVPAMNYLMVDGEGDPNTARSYRDAVEALFRVAYAIKFAVRGELAIDYGVMPLEGLWWADDMASFTGADKSAWKWTLMIMQPAIAGPRIIDDAIAAVHKKKALVALDRLRLERFSEGRCAQTLHIGPFAEEGPTVAKVHEFIAAQGRLAGKHHEIYLSDIRRAAPARWKTIIRQPFE